jgi:peptidoglycan/LPS O-acetylase OafA/YrhL
MRTAALRKTGELSFGIYLVHIPMLMFFGSRFGDGQWHFCASIAATFAAAAVLSALIERPGIALGRGLDPWFSGPLPRRRRGATGSAMTVAGVLKVAGV